MRVAILFAGLLVGSIAVWVGVQYGWQPPFALVWDSLSRIVLGLILFFLAVGSGWGLTAGIVIPGLPARFRLLPAIATNSAIGFLFIGISELSPGLTPFETGMAIGAWTGIGLLVGLLVGVVSNADKEPEANTSPQEHNARIGAVFVALVVAGVVFLMFPRGRVEPKVAIEGRHETAESVFEVGRASLLGEKYALVRITVRDATNSLVLEPAQWRRLTNLIATAEGSRSTTWQVVGFVSETDTSEHSRLEVSGGNGMRFVITSTHGPTVSYELPSSEFDEFNANAGAVSRTIGQ